VAVEPVPHDLADEAAELLEALHPVELRGADGGLVAASFADEPAVARAVVGLAAAAPEARLGLHARKEQLEVARRKLQVEVELAHVIELRRVDGLVSGVERLDDARAHASPPAVVAPDDADEVETRRVLGEDRRGVVGRTVVHDHPERRPDGLGSDRFQRAPRERRFVAARRDDDVAAPASETGHRTLTRCLRHHQPSA